MTIKEVTVFGLRMGFLVAAVLMCASGASAQVTPGTFKLSLEADLLSYQKLTVETEEDGATLEESDSRFAFGPGTVAGNTFPTFLTFGLGYVAHEHVIPQLAFSFGVSKDKSRYKSDSFSDSDDGPRLGVIVLQPRVELPFNPHDRLVWSAVLGADFRRIALHEEAEGEEDEDFDTALYAYGGVAGVSAHYFATDSLSIDFAALLALDGLKEKDDEVEPDSYRQFEFGLKVGLSGWL